MIDFLKSPQAIAAMIAAATSLVTIGLTLLTKNFIEKRLLIFKLNSEHKFEQRKKIKNVLASNKGHLLTACENLNYRLWNFSNEKHFEWMKINGDYHNPDNYYFQSFVYRILAVYAWMRKIELELIHLDTTIATSDDLEFIKFIRFYGRIFSDTAFFKGFEYDYCSQTDHIFKNNLDELYQNVTQGNKICSYNRYLEEISTNELKELTGFYRLLDGVNTKEDRLRWQWFQILKMLNLAFLNSYGYDYQQTSDKKMNIAMQTPMKSKLYDNFIFLLKEHKLDKQKEIKKLIKLLDIK
ncbi:MAG: hypothetical protein K9J13_13480 [Saprospiraceae bacterium]|nr:hypothetical protein [Saprospiraceae bacterium]